MMSVLPPTLFAKKKKSFVNILDNVKSLNVEEAMQEFTVKQTD